VNRYRAVAALAIMGCCLAVALAGCSGQATPVELTEKDSGSTQTLVVGQEMNISLESNPTTGYQWAVDGKLPSQLTEVGAPAYKAGSSAMGAGGTETWAFKATSPGTGTLNLKYWRSFEPTSTPAKTFTINISVK